MMTMTSKTPKSAQMYCGITKFHLLSKVPPGCVLVAEGAGAHTTKALRLPYLLWFTQLKFGLIVLARTPAPSGREGVEPEAPYACCSFYVPLMNVQWIWR